MKRLLVGILLLFPMLSIGQTTTSRFSFQDSLVVTTTKKDTTFTTERFETAEIMFSGCDGLVRFAMSTQDTVGWNRQGPAAKMKHYRLVEEGNILYIVPNKDLGITGLYRLDVRSVSGSGIMYLTGTKKVGE
jgi:hypothetical protein